MSFNLLRGYLKLQKEKREWVRKALEAIDKNDPAAQDEPTNRGYPGFRALYHHRAAHLLWEEGYERAARRYSEKWRRKTGIELHPGAVVGEGVFIDIMEWAW